MSDFLLSCPTCGSWALIKNCQMRHGKQNYKCNSCERLSWSTLVLIIQLDTIPRI